MLGTVTDFRLTNKEYSGVIKARVSIVSSSCRVYIYFS